MGNSYFPTKALTGFPLFFNYQIPRLFQTRFSAFQTMADMPKKKENGNFDRSVFLMGGFNLWVRVEE